MPKKSVEGRFWEKVDIRGEDDCWNWLASVNKGGYGRFGFNGKQQKAHRVSWMLHNGDIPEGMHVLHICIANRRCVNPDHLYLGTDQDNMDDKVNQGRVPKGEAHYKAKLTDEEVIEIRKKYIPWKYPLRKLAREYGVNQSTISDIVNNKTRRGT